MNCHVELWWIELWHYSNSDSLPHGHCTMHCTMCLEKKPRSSRVLPSSRDSEGSSTGVLASISFRTPGFKHGVCDAAFLHVTTPLLTFLALPPLGRVQRRSMLVFPLHCHRSLPCCLMTRFQCDIWFSPLAEPIYAALYVLCLYLWRINKLKQQQDSWKYEHSMFNKNFSSMWMELLIFCNM